jgi:PAS domain S-box-containing protein
VRAAVRAVTTDAEAASADALVLAQTLADMHQGSTRRTEIIVWAQVVILVLVLLLLAIMIIEPMVRSVDRRMTSARTLAGPLRRLALVPEYTSSIVLITDRHDRIRWSNAAFTQVVGWRYDEVRHGLPAEVLRHPEAPPAAVQALRDAVAHGRSLRQESLHRRKDGADLWLDLEMKPLRDGSGKVRGFVYLAADITERVAQQARMRLQWLALPVGVLVHAPDGVIVDTNREAERLLGCTREDLVGRRLPDAGWRFVRGDLTLCQPADLPAERTLRERMPLIGEVLGLRQGDGTLRWLLVNSQLQIGLGGAVTQVLVSFTDITGRFEATRARPVAVA